MTEEDFATLPSGIRLCYAIDGDETARPLLLITGLGLDLWSWHPSFVEALTAAGFRVIRFDNRDAGRSTRMTSRPPGRVRHMVGRSTVESYSLEDMAGDAVGLLDHLEIPVVDVVGMSLGGMLGQIVAASHPGRVNTLTSVMSTTGDRRVGRPAASTRIGLMRPPATDVEQFVRGYLRLMEHIAAGPYGIDRGAEEAWARQAWRRMTQTPGHVPGEGMARQIGAIDKSGDRTRALRTIAVATLVVHGDRDAMVHPSGGAATARAIRGARLVTLPGLRHHLPASVAPELSRLIVAHAHRA